MTYLALPLRLVATITETTTPLTVLLHPPGQLVALVQGLLFFLSVGLMVWLAYSLPRLLRPEKQTERELLSVEREKELQQRLQLLDTQRRYEALLPLLHARDRHLIEYHTLLPLENNQQVLQRWRLNHWKEHARYQLALTEHVRPLCYADYRSRVRSLSPTYRTLPGPALRAYEAWHLRHMHGTSLEEALLSDQAAREWEKTYGVIIA